jgi:hypothetical protein
MRYLVKATVNYPETEADTPDHVARDRSELLKWVHKLLDEPDATSFVVTIAKKD